MKAEDYEKAVFDYEKAKEVDTENAREIQGLLQKAKLELKKSKRKDYYKILGVEKNADENDIKKAYKRMALKYHPDKYSGEESASGDIEAKFKEIGEAYAVLSDPTKKRRYDSGADLEEMGGGMGGGVDVNDIFQMFFQQQGGFPRGFPRGGGGFGHSHGGGFGGHSHSRGGYGGAGFGGGGFGGYEYESDDD